MQLQCGLSIPKEAINPGNSTEADAPYDFRLFAFFKEAMIQPAKPLLNAFVAFGRLQEINKRSEHKHQKNQKYSDRRNQT